MKLQEKPTYSLLAILREKAKALPVQYQKDKNGKFIYRKKPFKVSGREFLAIDPKMKDQFGQRIEAHRFYDDFRAVEVDHQYNLERIYAQYDMAGVNHYCENVIEAHRRYNALHRRIGRWIRKQFKRIVPRPKLIS